MQAFCTKCWSLISTQDVVCPLCGADPGNDTRSFEQKLVAALEHPFPSTRARICWLLGQHGGSWSIPHLVRMLDDVDMFVRMAAIRALGEVGDESVVPALQRASKDDSLLLRIVAAGALEQVSARVFSHGKTRSKQQHGS